MLKGVLFVLVGAFLFGLTGFLFREEIPRERWFRRLADWRSTISAKPATLRLVRAPLIDASAPGVLEPIRR